MGGEVTWECNGSGQYVFTFRIYRDCSGSPIAPSNSNFYISNYPAVGSNTQLTVDVSQNVGDTIKPSCRGISPFNCGNGGGDEEAVFVSVRVMQPITLANTPPPEGWVVTFHQANRNDNDNIVNADGEQITLRAKIFSHSGTVPGQCVDNSPKFREKATSLLCLNSTFTYNHNAADDELDSLTYEWDQPFAGYNPSQPYNEGSNPRILGFVNPYSFSNPFPGPEALDINTGEISLSPNAPGKYVSVVKVTAYKCGEKVAEIYRELQSVVSGSCVASNAKPNIRPPFNDINGNPVLFSDTFRAGDLINFNLQIEDLASFNPPTYFGDTVILTATGQQFGANYTDPNSGCLNPPCATLSQSLPQKGLLGVNTTFNWQTDCNHVSFTDQCVSGQNTYTFVITASDDACPIPAINIATISITIVGDSVILSPLLNCVDVQSNGDVNLDWDPTPNINSSFTAWLIYSSTDRDGPFTLIDSIKNYNTTTYTHVGAGADQQQRFYHVRSRSGCKGVVTNVARDTVSTIFIEPTTNPTDVTVDWSPLNTPNPAGSANQYRVFREYPIGTGLSFYQNSTTNSITEIFPNCDDSVRYRVELINTAAGCTSSSAVQGYRYTFPDPQTNFSFPANPCPGQSISFTNLTTITGGAISYNWDFGDASGSTQTNPTHTYANPGTYTVSLTATSGQGCDSTFTQQITVTLPDADAGADQAICPGGSVQIGGSPTTSTVGATILWSPSTGLSGTSVANPMANPSVTTTYTVTVTDPAGCTQTDDVTVTVNPFPTADAGSPQTICPNASVQIGGSPTGPAGASYLWDNAGSLSSATVANPTANPSVTTTYTVTVTSGVNCSATDQVTVTVIPEPGADAGTDKTICPGSSVLIGGSPTSASAGATYSWSNSGSLSAGNIANPIASPSSTTTYTVTVTGTNGCTSTDDVIVNVGSAAAADAGPDQNICVGGSIQIGGSPTGAVGATFLWDNAASLSSATAANPTASPSVTTTYTVTVTEGGLGCTNTDQVTVFVNPIPTADAGTDVAICDGTSTTIGGSPTGPAGAIYLWDNAGSLSNATAANPTATPTVTTTYTVTVTSGPGCTDTDQITVTVNPNPTADAGSPGAFCAGDVSPFGGSNPIILGGSPTSTTPGATYSWSPAGDLNNSTLANPEVVSPSGTGFPYNVTYTVTVTAPNGCTAVDNVSINIIPEPIVDVSLTNPTTICEGEVVNLDGSASSFGFGTTFTWSSNFSPTPPEVANTSAISTTATPTVTTTYFLAISDLGGGGQVCSSSDQVTITVNSPSAVDAGSDQTICNGGSVQIGGSPTGPAGSTFLWDNAATLSAANIANPIASPTTTTTYTVTVTDGNGCTNTDDVTVTVNALPAADAGADQSICNGGSVSIGGSPTGPAGSTFLWDNAASLSSATSANPTANPVVTTIYTVTVTDVNGCTSTDDVTVNVGALPTVDAGADQTICEGSSVVIGGSPTGPAGSTYQWDNISSLSNGNVANPTANPTMTTTYSVTVTDPSGCSDVDMVTITVDPVPTVDAGVDQVICDGNPVQIGGSPTSSTAGATFAWDNGGSLSANNIANPMASPSVTTVYTVTVTHPNGCTNTDDVTVTVNTNPVADAGLDQTLCLGETATIGGSPTGPAGSSYLWDNAISLSAANVANPIATPIITTTYSVTVTDGNGCSAVDQVVITVNSRPDADAGPDQTICTGSDVVIGGSPTSSIVGATFNWDNGASLSANNIANPTASPTTTTTYTVTVTHANGCTNTDQMVVTVNSSAPADAGADQTICLGGSVQVGGSPTGPAGSTFLWDNAATLDNVAIANPNATPTVTTTYEVTVTDANGCTGVDQVLVTVNPLPTADAGADQTICDGQSVQIGGSPTGPVGATYQWNNTASLDNGNIANPTANPTTTTTYSVTVTDGNSCTAIDQVTVTVNETPTADAGVDQTICNGNPVQIGGLPTSSTVGATFLWDNAATLSNASIANPLANPTVNTVYTVTVTHPNGCTNTDDVTVTVNGNPGVDAGADQTICLGTTAVIGGSPTGPAGASYFWDNGASLSSNSIANPIASPTATTTYSVTVTDVNGCTGVDQVLITVNPFPDVDAGSDQTICEGQATNIGGAPTSATAGATFLWDNATSLSSASDPNPIATPIITTVYTVTVTHPNGCTNTDDMTVFVNPAPTTDAGPDQAICIGGSVQIGGSPTGPASSTYQWDNSASLSADNIANPVATPTSTTTYSVTVTDLNGCTNTDDVLVTVNPLPSADAGPDQVICETESIQIGGMPTGPTGATYLWDNSASLSADNVANPMASPTITTTYSVTVTDVNGCSDVDQVIVNVNPLPDADAGVDQTICALQTVQIGGTPTSTTVGATFAWDNATTLSDNLIANPIAGPTTTTLYTVTVTHPNGCTQTDQVLVTVNPIPVADAGLDQDLCIGSSIVIGGSPTGPAGATYLWDNSASLDADNIANPTATPTVTTTYTVTVTDGVGCTNTDQIVITVIPVPDADAGVDQALCIGQSVTIGGSPTSNVAGATFAWDNAASLSANNVANPIATPTSTTTYTVTVTHPNGCTATDDVVVTVNPLPTADAGADQALCIGGSVTIGGSPTGPAGANYTWDNGGSLSSTSLANPVATPTVTTTYTVTVTDVNGCTNTDDVTITVNPLPIVDAGIDQTICLGESIAIGGTPTGPVGSTFLWDNAASLSADNVANPVATPTVNTTYSVTVTDINGCSDVDQVTITVNPVPDADAGSDVTICSLASTVIGGSPTSSVVGATFAWDNGASLSAANIANPTANPSITTTYTVTVTHPNGCTATDDVTVTVTPLPVADAGADQDLCIGSSTSIGGSPTGPVGATFAWDNGASLSSTTDPNPIANPTVTTTYTVTVTDGVGCTNTDQVIITVIPIPDADAGPDQTICNLQQVSIGGSPTSNTVGATFLWDNSASLSADNIANPIASPNTTTVYTVTVTHPNGCTNTDDVTVTVNPLPVTDAGVDRAICIGENTVLGGSPTGPAGSLYTWDNAGSLSSASDPNPTANPTVTTTYTVTVVDLNGCANTDQVIVTVNPLPIVDAGSDVTICEGESTTIGGAPTGPAGSAYLWDNAAVLSSASIANPVASPTVTTTFTVTVTDVNGCVNTDQIIVNVNAAPDVDAGVDVAICNTDTIILGGSPTTSVANSTFLWDNAASLDYDTLANPKAFPNATTTYSVTVTDPFGCTSVDQVTISVNPLPIVDFTVDETCIGNLAAFTDQSTITAGSLMSWEWKFGDGIGTSILQNPAYEYQNAGSYDVTLIVTSALGCIDSIVKNVTINPLPVADAGAEKQLCYGDTVELGGNPTGPSGATFSWNPGFDLSDVSAANPKAFPLATTKYYLSVTDQNGCINYDSVDVIVNPLPIVTANNDTVLCVDQPVQLNASGALTYVWTPAKWLNNPLIANPIATTTENVSYVVSGTDANGCVNTDTVNIEVFNVNFAGADTTICYGDSVQLNPIVQGDLSGITYSWSPSIGLSATNIRDPKASPPIDLMYQIRVTNSAGCFDRDSILVKHFESPVPNFEYVNSPRCFGSVLEIVNTSSFTNSYRWYLNGKFMTSDYQPEFGLDHTVENRVTLVAINDNCTDSIVKVIPPQPLKELLQLKFANVFTPNGDGENDIFDLGFTGEFVGCANFQVYDRWGDKVFDTNIGQYGWDGRDLRGQRCKEGVYYYIVRLGTEEVRGSVYLTR